MARYIDKKSHDNEAASAFRFFFQRPHYPQEILERPAGFDHGIGGSGGYYSDPTAALVSFRVIQMQKYGDQLDRWQAARRAVERLYREPDGAAKVSILRAAYDTPFHKGVANRVRWEAGRVHISERCAWYWIERACKYFSDFLAKSKSVQ